MSKRWIDYLREPKQKMPEYVFLFADGTFRWKELVRCKDCKFYNPHIRECEGFGKWFGLEDEWGDNDFCSRGERKDEVKE